MIRMYETELCPDCVAAKKRLREEGIEYEDIDITSSIGKLKEFMALRDSRAEFDVVKDNKQVGVPAFIREDGQIVFSVEEL
ncbi:MAG: glutaredoxin domain-containing protein [Peptoniphilus sp.]|nr:glutaredoxin domain-containing protein [Peptoniphilus sp.]MDD7363063.1 glutaredoxin domain-containing protein [Bacillota bacterium]MDY6045328.1 glutaredoxin domain-containing protein [Peptoniphilus sp.]